MIIYGIIIEGIFRAHVERINGKCDLYIERV